MKLTTHTIVKNEQNWIKPALLSVIDYADTMLVYDTGSTDHTIDIVKSLNSPKIKLTEYSHINRDKLINLRNLQIQQTHTDWFLILDGDEIWPQKNLVKLIKAMDSAGKNILALVNKTRNCVGDIFHYLPESQGHYRIGPWQGHLNIRAIKNVPTLKVIGQYPHEAYTVNSIPLQDQPERLGFVDTWYLHTTHLKRSGFFHQLKVIDRLKKRKVLSKTLIMSPKDLPETLG